MREIRDNLKLNLNSFYAAVAAASPVSTENTQEGPLGKINKFYNLPTTIIDRTKCPVVVVLLMTIMP